MHRVKGCTQNAACPQLQVPAVRAAASIGICCVINILRSLLSPHLDSDPFAALHLCLLPAGLVVLSLPAPGEK
jgi:hypothetical protein